MNITKIPHSDLLALAKENVASFPANKHLYEANEATYLQAIFDIATKGRIKMSRPGQPTISSSGTQTEYDLTGNKIPLLRSRLMFTRSFLIENQWFLTGSDDVEFLKERNVSIWDSWVTPETAVFEPTEKQTGFDMETFIRCHSPKTFKELVEYKAQNAISIPTVEQINQFLIERRGLFSLLDIPQVRLTGGKIGAGAYGPSWRKWEDTRSIPEATLAECEALEARGFESFGNEFLVNMIFHEMYSRNIDQIANVIKMLRTNPDSRRIMVSAWNAAKTDEAALPPCHFCFQFVSYDNFDGGPRDLVCNLFMRSNDSLVGKSTNIAQYAALTHLIAKITNHKAVKLVLNVSDDHIYSDQVPLLKEQFTRAPINSPCATIEFPDNIKELDDYIKMTPSEIQTLIKGYEIGSQHPRMNYPVAV